MEYSYGPMIVELEAVMGELERIAWLRRYMREALLDFVDDLWLIRGKLLWNLCCTNEVEREVSIEVVRSLESLCIKLENLLMRRRRMREALIRVAYRLDHVKNKMKCNLIN